MKSNVVIIILMGMIIIPTSNYLYAGDLFLYAERGDTLESYPRFGFGVSYTNDINYKAYGGPALTFQNIEAEVKLSGFMTGIGLLFYF